MLVQAAAQVVLQAAVQAAVQAVVQPLLLWSGGRSRLATCICLRASRPPSEPGTYRQKPRWQHRNAARGQLGKQWLSSHHHCPVKGQQRKAVMTMISCKLPADIDWSLDARGGCSEGVYIL
jgi:hypothetical protein